MISSKERIAIFEATPVGQLWTIFMIAWGNAHSHDTPEAWDEALAAREKFLTALLAALDDVGSECWSI